MPSIDMVSRFMGKTIGTYKGKSVYCTSVKEYFAHKEEADSLNVFWLVSTLGHDDSGVLVYHGKITDAFDVVNGVGKISATNAMYPEVWFADHSCVKEWQAKRTANTATIKIDTNNTYGSISMSDVTEAIAKLAKAAVDAADVMPTREEAEHAAKVLKNRRQKMREERVVTERKSVDWYVNHTLELLHEGCTYGERKLKELSNHHVS